MFGRVSAPATVPMETRRQTTAEEAFATAGGGMAWSGSGEDGAGGEWGGDREGPAVPLPHEHGVPYWHPGASSAVALRRRLMEAGGERSKGRRGAAPAGVFLREDGFPVGDEGQQVAHPSSRDGGRDRRQQQLHEQQQPRHGYLHQRQQRRHSDTGIENRELWQEGSEERRPYGW
ncbi:expressed unknown protein [Ectocarpus siliculosus]|uniref:Uncharacterized protein n=1 Tax=Ectocarpus siliculosus TaxID=2880 RepID=D7FUW6_ECTSI|nr:expressed unknown protein [Ectocarpus siliculosus]|eukprot:CBJ31772.1 expressed unknown protein [Ectocarpus siliculosus]